MARFLCRRNIALISDEIYEAITYDGHKHISPASLSPEMRERCVVVNSLSKTYAMTGWRLGYCAAPATIIQAMLLVLQQSSRGPATFIQDAGAAALTGPQDCVPRCATTYAQRRRPVIDALAGLPARRRARARRRILRHAGRDAHRLPSDEVRRRLLHEHGVVVVHGRPTATAAKARCASRLRAAATR